jgi:hypothetical protein|tara:strand:+ start:60 stop:266 length:207 start_codon:yes stop_codon:yes gene_type:complete
MTKEQIAIAKKKGIVINEDGIVFINIDGNKYLIDDVKDVYRSYMQLVAKARHVDVTSHEKTDRKLEWS